MQRHLGRSLRFKVAIGVALPVFLGLAAFSGVQYVRERQILLDRLEEQAIRLNEVMRGSLRHAMLTADRGMLLETLRNIGRQQSVLRVAIIDSNGQLVASDRPQDFQPPPNRDSPGCQECHRPSGVLDRHSIVVRPAEQAPLLRSSILIANEPECEGCHGSEKATLGVLIADFSLTDLESNATGDLRTSLALSVVATVLVTAGVYGLVHVLVVRRVERFEVPLAKIAWGDFSERVPVDADDVDELAELGRAVNRMAEDLAQQAELERRASSARWQAILEERQRLARELHDGVAQVLGYVNTKALAAQLLLRQGKTAEAAEQLSQLEGAARSVFGELRQAILDLKTAVQGEGGLAAALAEHVERFGQLSGIPASLEVDGELETWSLPPESEIQLMRIVQEALTNVRKHSGASQAWVRLRPNGGRELVVVVSDDGRGFDLRASESDRRPHFGLASMRERAQAVGGDFRLDSGSGKGTRVVITLPLINKEIPANDHARAGGG